MSLFKRAWMGQEKLWIVFWLYNVVGGIVLKLLMGTVALQSLSLGFVFLAVYIIYIVWLLVALWRCAWNTAWKFWGYVVRVLIALVPIIVIGAMLAGFVLAGNELSTASECRKMLTSRAAGLGMDYETYTRQNRNVVTQCMERGGFEKSESGGLNRLRARASQNSSDAPDAVQGRDMLVGAHGPAVDPAAPTLDPQNPRVALCDKSLRDFAVEHHVDPDQYMANSQAAYRQCVEGTLGKE